MRRVLPPLLAVNVLYCAVRVHDRREDWFNWLAVQKNWEKKRNKTITTRNTWQQQLSDQMELAAKRYSPTASAFVIFG